MTLRTSTCALACAIAAALLASTSSAQIVGDPPDPGKVWPHPVSPPGNPFPRDSAPPAQVAERDAKVRLGKLLFWDEQVSIDNTVACGTCHAIAGGGGTDARLGAVFTGGGINNGNFGAFGVIPQSKDASGSIVFGDGSSGIDRQVTPLHTPTMIGAFMLARQFWETAGSVGPAFLQNDGTPFAGGRPGPVFRKVWDVFQKRKPHAVTA